MNGTKIRILSISASTKYPLRKLRRFSTMLRRAEALVIPDPEHSQDEERFIILGMSRQANLLVVCHCYRESETVIRIISARKATRNESVQYQGWE